MLDVLSSPWPWYVAGPLIGLMVPALLIVGGKMFGISSSLRHICAAVVPGNVAFFKYNWRKVGSWNLVFVVGVLIGGFIAGNWLTNPGSVIGISEATVADLQEIGITDFSGLVPSELISWSGLASLPGMLLIIAGGFLIGFGSRYAGGCTSGHAISGLSDFQLPSLIAVVGFFIGGLLVTHVLLPFILN